MTQELPPLPDHARRLVEAELDYAQQLGLAMKLMGDQLWFAITGGRYVEVNIDGTRSWHTENRRLVQDDHD